MTWQPPQINRKQHAMIEEFMIVHEVVDLYAKQEALVEVDARWSNSHGFKKSDGARLIRTSETTFTVHDLAPASGHSFLLMSRSAAGWSKPSAKLVHFTLPSVPSEPSGVELLKINKNGVVISWHKPLLDNGCRIQLYQIEMSDVEPQWEVDESENESLEERSLMSSTSAGASKASMSLASQSVSLSSAGQRNLEGQWHRIIKHRHVDHCEKYLMGLETDHKYYFRCAAKNEVGWGPWGPWAGPYIPGEGVQVDEFGDMCLTLRWVAPVLVNREVTAYEVQMCEPSGPRKNAITVFSRRPSNAVGGETEEAAAQSKADGYEYRTVTDSISDNEAFIDNLKPGIRYQFRVRPQIDGVWCDWALGQSSNIFAIPASAPEVPTDVCVGTLNPTLFRAKRRDDSSVQEAEEISENKAPDNADESKTEGDVVSIYYNREMRTPAIAHDSILITWTNGVPNGSPIVQNDIEIARVRCYNHEDTVLSLDAAGKLESPDKSQELTAKDFDITGDLGWQDATLNGKYISSTSYRACGLQPDSGYIFRVRQRNGVGWSKWSLASSVITTLSAAPPTPPEAVHLGTYYAIMQWDMQGGQFGYTILDYELQLALLPSGKRMDPNVPDADDSNWDTPLEWIIPETRRVDDPESAVSMSGTAKEFLRTTDKVSAGSGDNFDCKRVFVDKLLPMSVYVSRIKVRTVTGWTAWSGIGQPFRTLSPP
jgi:hypothetical protein